MTWDDIYRDPKYCKRTPNPQVVKWLATLPKGSVIIDVGCGVGRHMDAMTAFNFWGCDPSSNAVTGAVQVHGRERVQVATAQGMPYPDDTFDAALCFGVMQYLASEAEIALALAEIARVLKPDGKLMLVTRTVSDDRNFGKIPEAEQDMPMVFLMKSEVEEMLRTAGFGDGIIGRMAIDWPGGIHDDDWVVFATKQ